MKLLITFSLLIASCSLHAVSLLGQQVGESAYLSKVDNELKTLALTPDIRPMPGAIKMTKGRRAIPLDTKGNLLPLIVDTQGRVLVRVTLDGSVRMQVVKAQLTNIGATVTSELITYRDGVLNAYLPSERISDAAQILGIRSIMSECLPMANVGSVHTQGPVVIKSNLVNQQLGLTGKGINVGVISTSFNTAQLNTANPPATTAAQDIATGDLPAKGVRVIEDFTNGGQGSTDEGRAMCQIVHAVVPDANLAFATGLNGSVDFANNIINLRTKANCSVIVDDLFIFGQPLFSEGIIAQSIDNVSTNTALSGKPVVYCNAAGNNGNKGYRGDYHNLSDAQVRSSQGFGNLKFPTNPNAAGYVDPALTAGGWHNWNATGAGKPEASATIQMNFGRNPNGSIDPSNAFPYRIFLQWDDPFDLSNGITTNYNLLLFDQDGNYLSTLSDPSNSFSFQESIKVTSYLQTGKVYQVAITRTTQTNGVTPQLATHLAIYFDFEDGSITGKYFSPPTSSPNPPNIVCNNNARAAITVGAYVYDWTNTNVFSPQLEPYSCPGPSIYYFDSNGIRLTQPQTSLKPKICGPDGVATTFFGQQYFQTHYSFFGTSCAAPQVAGVAALMLEAKGGAGTLQSSRIQQILEQTALPGLAVPFVSSATAQSGNNTTITIVSTGSAQYRNNAFFIAFKAGSNPAQSINSIVFDVSSLGLVFNTQDRYRPVITTQGLKPSNVTIEPTNSMLGSPQLVVRFTPGTFRPGGVVNFNLEILNKAYPNRNTSRSVIDGADLASSTFVASVTNNTNHSTQSLHGVFQTSANHTGYSPFDGYGLVNAYEAVKAILSQHKLVQ